MTCADALSCRCSYHDGVMRLEPPLSHLPSLPSYHHPCYPSSKFELKQSILTHLEHQIEEYARNGTACGLAPTKRRNVGRELRAETYRTADLYVDVLAANNLNVEYDCMPRRGAAFVLDVVVGGAEEVQEAIEGIDVWFAAVREVKQAVLMHVDAEKLESCRGRSKGASLRGTEEIGTVWRWGRTTKGGKILVEQTVSSRSLHLHCDVADRSDSQLCTTMTGTPTFPSAPSTSRGISGSLYRWVRRWRSCWTGTMHSTVSTFRSMRATRERTH